MSAKCHHQITYIKFKLNVIYLPPYEWEVLHYKLANSECIEGGIDIFDREKLKKTSDAFQCNCP